MADAALAREQPRRFADLVYTAAERTPDALAVGDGVRVFTYGDLVAVVDRLAEMIKSIGVGPADRLMIVGENGVTLGALILAGNRAGVRLVLENARRAVAEIAVIAAHCRPRHILFVTENSADAARHGEMFGAVPIVDAAVGTFALARDVAPTDAASHDDPDYAAMIYTTGTTGQPKGVMLRDGNLCFIATMMAELRNIGPGDQVYGILPITHVMGLASVFLGSLRNGASLHMRSRFTPDNCLDELAALEITALQGATAMFSKLAERAAARGWRGPARLRFIAAGGSPIDLTVKRKVEALLGPALHNGYGLTEAASTCWTRFDQGCWDDSVGPPLPGVEVRVMTPEGDPVACGEVGELWVRGPNVMVGYFREPALTARCLTPDGWFNSQDLARLGSDGRVFIIGRTKDVIKHSGFNVYPLEVETALNAHPSIVHSAVVGRTVEGNEEVVAFLELVPAADGVPADLREHLRGILSPYKHPAVYTVLSALPLAPNGKVLKAHLQQIAREMAK